MFARATSLYNVCLENDFFLLVKSVETDEGVTGLTATIKQRFYNHQLSFKDAKYQNCMALSKYVWLLKNNVNFAIKWSIQKKSPAFNNAAKRCDLCLAEIKSLRLHWLIRTRP